MKELWGRIKSWERPFQKLAWPLTLIFVVVGIIIFFISYSLARHKRMVHKLRVQVLKLQTENKIAELEKLKAMEKLKLTGLKKDNEHNKAERKKIRDQISKINEQERQAKEQLKKRRKDLDSDNLDTLLSKAKQLVKDTL